MAHIHSINDDDVRVRINGDTREITFLGADAPCLIQHDHNSERFSFEIPRYVEGHDMSLSTKVEIHYTNISADGKNQSKDVYPVEDLAVSTSDDTLVTFSWLISGNATQYAGTLHFLIRFVCLTDDTIDYAWNTAIYEGITVGKGMNNGESVVTEYTDVLEAWKREIFAQIDSDLSTELAEFEAAVDAKAADTLATIPANYTTLSNNVTYNTKRQTAVMIMEAVYGIPYFEGDTTGSNPLYFAFTGSLYIRGGISATLTWSTFKTALVDHVVTSPNGRECIKIPHNSSLYINTSGTLSIASTTATPGSKVPIFCVSSGRSWWGIGQHIYEHSVRLKEGASYTTKTASAVWGGFELGTISAGANMADTTRIRTNELVYMPKGTTLIVKDSAVSLISVQMYNASGAYVKQQSWINATSPYVLSDNYKVRIAVSKGDHSVIGDTAYATLTDNIIVEMPPPSVDYVQTLHPADKPSVFDGEVEDCVAKLGTACEKKAYVFALVTDTHYNGTAASNWHNTLRNIGAVNGQYKLDAIYHLGDLVDGDKSKTETRGLLAEMRNALYGINPETYILAGNHDDNSFTETAGTDDTTKQYTKAEQYSILHRHKDIDVVREGNNLYWYKDLPAFGIRVICLDSRASASYPGSWGAAWGYPDAEVAWLRDVALNTEYQVLLLSHMAVTSEYNAYGSTNTIVNGDAIRTVLEGFKANGGTVIGLFHGHTHWDYMGVKNTDGIREVSTACSLTDDWLPAYVPDGATAPARASGAVTEDLWDIVVVQPTERTVKLIRFGAGDDRQFNY